MKLESTAEIKLEKMRNVEIKQYATKKQKG